MLVFCLFDLFIENILCSCFVCLCCLYKAVYITTCILVEFFLYPQVYPVITFL